jgi:ribosomal protein L37AE/L43A
MTTCPQCSLCFFQEVLNEAKKIHHCKDCGCTYAVLKPGTLTPGEYLTEHFKNQTGTTPQP